MSNTKTDTTLRGLSGYQLQRATGAAMHCYKEVFAQFGLRRTTFSCLSLIVDHPGLSQSQLADVLSIERPNLVQIVEDLSTQGLITREPSKTDRRAYALQPTAKGAALFGVAWKAIEDLDHAMTEGLSAAERTALEKALAKIEANAVSYEAAGAEAAAG